MEEKLTATMSAALDRMQELLQEKELTEQVQAALSTLNQIATNVAMCENLLLRAQVKSLWEHETARYPAGFPKSKEN